MDKSRTVNYEELKLVAELESIVYALEETEKVHGELHQDLIERARDEYNHALAGLVVIRGDSTAIDDIKEFKW